MAVSCSSVDSDCLSQGSTFPKDKRQQKFFSLFVGLTSKREWNVGLQIPSDLVQMIFVFYWNPYVSRFSKVFKGPALEVSADGLRVTVLGAAEMGLRESTFTGAAMAKAFRMSSWQRFQGATIALENCVEIGDIAAIRVKYEHPEIGRGENLGNCFFTGVISDTNMSALRKDCHKWVGNPSWNGWDFTGAFGIDDSDQTYDGGLMESALVSERHFGSGDPVLMVVDLSDESKPHLRFTVSKTGGDKQYTLDLPRDCAKWWPVFCPFSNGVIATIDFFDIVDGELLPLKR